MFKHLLTLLQKHTCLTYIRTTGWSLHRHVWCQGSDSSVPDRRHDCIVTYL